MKLIRFAAIPVLALMGCKSGGASSGAGGSGGAALTGAGGSGGAAAGSSGAAGSGGSGAAGATGGASAGTAGAAGASSSTDAAVAADAALDGSGDRTSGTCVPAGPELQFSLRRVAGFQPLSPTDTTQPTEDIRHASIVIGTGGVPIFVYLVRAQVFALPLTSVDFSDAGVTGNVSKILSDPSLTRVSHVSRAATKSDGSVAVAYLSANHAYEAEWSGRMADSPTGSQLTPTTNETSKVGFAVDGRDRAHIVFGDTSNGTKAYYATNENGTWSVENIGPYQPYPAVASDSGGNILVGLSNPFVSFPQLVLGTRRGGVWQLAPTDAADAGVTGAWNFDPVVVMDSQDRFNLFFRAAPPPSGVVVANEVDWWVSAGSSWTKTTAGVGGPIGDGDGLHFDVAFTPGGEVYIARVGSPSGIAYDHFDGCKWTSHQIDTPPAQSTSFEIWWPSVAVDSTGRPHFSFQEMHYADHNQDELWSAEPIP
jgi:hypothetical protein